MPLLQAKPSGRDFPAVPAAHDASTPITTRGGWGVKRKGWEGGVPETAFTPPCTQSLPAHLLGICSLGLQPAVALGLPGCSEGTKIVREREVKRQGDKLVGGVDWQEQREREKGAKRELEACLAGRAYDSRS